MDSQRRNFLKSAAMAAATSMVAGNNRGMALPVLSDETAIDGDNVEWNKAPCRFCGTGCHVQVGVHQGKVVAVAGDPTGQS